MVHKWGLIWMIKDWEVKYDTALGNTYFHLSKYSVTSGNKFTEEDVPDGTTISDNRVSKIETVSLSAIFIGEDFQNRYDILKKLENSDDTNNFYVRPKFEGGRREFIRNLGIETIVKEVGNEENCIYCTINLKQINKSTVAISTTTYKGRAKNVKLEAQEPSEIEIEKADIILTEKKKQEIYQASYFNDVNKLDELLLGGG